MEGMKGRERRRKQGGAGENKERREERIWEDMCDWRRREEGRDFC